MEGRGVFDALPAHLASDLTSLADERPSGPVRGGLGVVSGVFRTVGSGT